MLILTSDNLEMKRSLNLHRTDEDIKSVEIIFKIEKNI